MQRVSVRWAKHLSDEEQKDKFLKTIYSSGAALDRLKEIIDELLEEAELKSLGFETPNWPYVQASVIGEKKALNKIKDIITIKN